MLEDLALCNQVVNLNDIKLPNINTGQPHQHRKRRRNQPSRAKPFGSAATKQPCKTQSEGIPKDISWRAWKTYQRINERNRILHSLRFHGIPEHQTRIYTANLQRDETYFERYYLLLPLFDCLSETDKSILKKCNYISIEV